MKKFTKCPFFKNKQLYPLSFGCKARKILIIRVSYVFWEKSALLETCPSMPKPPATITFSHTLRSKTSGKFKKNKTFRKNFTCGWEDEGAAFAVYYKGKLVVDLWGGYADKSCLRPWTEDTLCVVFSTTKVGLPPKIFSIS
jgi:hypothetical protein